MTTPIVPAMKPSASEREDLAKLIDPIAFEEPDDHPEIGRRRGHARAAAERALAAGFRRDPGWIACETRMPASDLYVIAHSPKHGVVPLVAAWDHARDCWFDYTGDGYEMDQITHWQPLPPAPGDNDKAREGMA